MADDLTQTLNGDETPHQQIMARFDAMEARINDQFAGIDDRLLTLEAKVDDRLRETRPIWERALAEILNLTEQVKETNHRLAEMKESLSIVGEDWLIIKGKQRHLETRVKALEDDRQPQ